MYHENTNWAASYYDSKERDKYVEETTATIPFHQPCLDRSVTCDGFVVVLLGSILSEYIPCLACVQHALLCSYHRIHAYQEK